MELIERKLESIEKLITAIDLAPKAATPKGALPPPMGTGGFDALPAAVYKDSDEPLPGEVMELVPEDELHLQEKARLDFGRRLAAMVGLKALSFRAVNSLPPSAAVNNAFSNSYHYNVHEDTLYVHSNRLTSSGDFGLIVIHALSHIKVTATLEYILFKKRPLTYFNLYIRHALNYR
jgi:hypothetical protein